MYVRMYVYTHIYTYTYTYTYISAQAHKAAPWTAWPQGPSAYALVAHIGLHSCVHS
jgi:hypothetical protein